MRSVPLSFRQAAESQYNDEVDLIFVTISHPLLLVPVRVVWDSKDFVYGGNTFTGFPFDLTLLSDDDNAPKAQLTFQNVDQSIGETIRNLGQAPRLKIEFLHSSDFDLTVTPRVPLGTPSVVLTADKLYLSNVKVDVLTVTADINGWDFSQRVWPSQRATQDFLPALYL